AGNSSQSAQNADRMPSQKPSIKSPKARNYPPSTSINGSSIPPFLSRLSGFCVDKKGSQLRIIIIFWFSTNVEIP
ncbi:hypothetical protein, partial [Komagataeibacter sp. NFXK3]